MIPKSGYRFSDKIMPKNIAETKWGFDLAPFRHAPIKRMDRSACI
jgi:hypothetical protein